MWFCDPFGHTGVKNLFNYGSDIDIEKKYVFFHDQEPVQLSSHRKLFRAVVKKNIDMYDNMQISHEGTVIVSEKGECVTQLESRYGWRSLYYFFHGWACLDWYRGYNRTFLFPQPRDRAPPKKTFMSPNRIIGGQRGHRILFLYHVIKQSLTNNFISAPSICPVENIPISELAMPYFNTYPDIEQVLHSARLPWLFANEPTQHMTSCWLSNFEEATNSLIYVPTETVFFGRRTHITEKTFKAIALGMPFILVAPAGSLEYLRSYGFRTFADVWCEDYDLETDDLLRIKKVVDLLRNIDSLSQAEKFKIQQRVLPAVEHNWNHFYRGGFESVLWPELKGMLGAI